jgi:hypothetical protein
MRTAVPLKRHTFWPEHKTSFHPKWFDTRDVRVDGDMKIVRVGNAQAHYMLTCGIKAEGCITPERSKDYFLIDQNTHWKMPGAKDFLTLAFLQDLVGKYNSTTSEHIGLISTEAAGIGIFLFDRKWGYQRDTIFYDGPIIYGAGMNDADRQRTWKSFFLKMVDAALRQQGQDMLQAKVTPRCSPGEDVCTMLLDAKLVGVGGGKEARNVLLIVQTDVRDPQIHVSRVVCTWPFGERVCRDWNTGKFIVEE